MIYVLLGETASGKSAVALNICREMKIPLLSADAFAVYQGFDIGSAKPTLKELRGIEHYFISTQEFGQAFSVYDFQKQGRILLNQWQKEGRDCVVVGGSFLYIRALLFPYYFPPNVSNALHQEWTLEQMRAKLLELQPNIATQVDLNNSRRVERALALAEAGIAKTQVLQKFAPIPLYPTTFIRLQTDVMELQTKINRRVDEQVTQGLFEEESRLAKLNPAFAAGFKGIGFSEIYQGKQQGMATNAIIEKIKIDTRRYAKRQRTFLRHQFPLQVEVEVAKIPPLVVEDIRRRKKMADTQKDTENALLLPLIPVLNKSYLPWIDNMYLKGVRQIGVFTLDQALKKDFAENVHVHSPLMQILYFDQTDFTSDKLPRFSFVLPLIEEVIIDPLLQEFIAKQGISNEVPKDLQLIIEK